MDINEVTYDFFKSHDALNPTTEFIRNVFHSKIMPIINITYPTC